jgi:signal transduction histidine kinase/ActR/RegA family two-component response regulator
MTAAEARRGYRVRIRATVVVSLPFWHMFLLQEGTAGICVSTGAVARPDIAPGAVVEVEGNTAAGDFAPVIQAKSVTVSGSTPLPQATPVSLEQLASGLYDSQWIETEGVVRGVFLRKGHLLLILGSGASRMEVLAASGSEEEARRLVGSRVRLRGTGAGVFNHQHRLIGVSIYSTGLSEMHVIEAAPENPFALPVTPIPDVARYAPGWSPEQRIHIQGRLAAQWPGKSVFLTDGSQSVEVLTETAQIFQPGDVLDVVAFRAPGTVSYNLDDAEIKRLSQGAPPAPRPISANQALTGEFDQSLVQVEGRLINSQMSPNQATLMLKSGDRVFMAILPGVPGPAFAGRLRDGSKVRLAGIFVMDDANSNRPRRPVQSFRIVMRSPDDLRILENPSWWTLTHAFSTMTLMLVSGVGILAWVIALRRRVKSQTRVIQEQLREAQVLRDRAEAANRSKSEFLANMSHDIRTPMNGIIGMTDLVLHSELNEDQQECLHIVRSSADSLLSLINDILDFSKIEAGKLDMESVAFPLRECLNDTVRMLSFRAVEKGLGLSCRVHSDIPEMVKGDPARLRQIVLNLAGNAIKFTPAGQVSIEVTRDADELLHFVVRDTGIGIPPEHQQTIFQPFVQSDTGTFRQYGGTGLGLSICARLVEMMQGKIWVVSQPGQGSEFHFTARLETAASPVVALKLVTDARQAAVSEKLRVLVAEDNAVNHKIVARILEKEGHEVLAAWNGCEALDILERETVDVILMDVHMPEMDGLEAAAEIRVRERGTGLSRPIIAATACAMKGDREKCLAAGMNAYIAKPIQAKQLLQIIENIVAKDRARQLVNA